MWFGARERLYLLSITLREQGMGQSQAHPHAGGCSSPIHVWAVLRLILAEEVMEK